jgi:Holliday junction resolvase RusA-like endonuclease
MGREMKRHKPETTPCGHIVIEAIDIRIISINRKYGSFNGKVFLDKNFRQFKKELYFSVKPIRIDPPYRVDILIWTYSDIDNATKVILDVLQDRGVITNDSEVTALCVEKIKIKKGSLGKIIVNVESISK